MSTLTLGAAVRQPAHSTRKPVRLTRRGVALVRTLIVSSLLVVGIAVTSAFGAAQASSEPAAPLKTVTVVVMPGETLWTIAGEFNTGNPGALIDRIKDLNGLTSSSVQAGQRLLVPVK